MRTENELRVIKILLFASLILSLNLLYLDLRMLGIIGGGPNVLGTKTSVQACPTACVTEIKKEIAGTKGASSSSISAVKESFVPIGTGTNASDDWQDVPGLQVIIDTAQYGKIKEVYFEASLHSDANQNAHVRLYNVTDDHPVWFSELTFNNTIKPASQTSSKITLDTGNKAYKVQMKTQLKYTSTLDQSRIRIVSY